MLRCRIAPARFGWGRWGNWTELGNLLMQSPRVDQVILAPVTISGSPIPRWVPGGDLNAAMIETLSKACTGAAMRRRKRSGIRARSIMCSAPAKRFIAYRLKRSMFRLMQRALQPHSLCPSPRMWAPATMASGLILPTTPSSRAKSGCDRGHQGWHQYGRIARRSRSARWLPFQRHWRAQGCGRLGRVATDGRLIIRIWFSGPRLFRGLVRPAYRLAAKTSAPPRLPSWRRHELRAGLQSAAKLRGETLTKDDAN